MTSILVLREKDNGRVTSFERNTQSISGLIKRCELNFSQKKESRNKERYNVKEKVLKKEKRKIK